MCQNFSGDYLTAFYENFLFSSLYLFTFPKLFMVDLYCFLIVQNILRKCIQLKYYMWHLTSILPKDILNYPPSRAEGILEEIPKEKLADHLMKSHSKRLLPTTLEKTLPVDITRWSIPKSDWLYSLQPKMEKLYIVSKNKTRSWLWLRLWTPYCQIQTDIE